MSEWNDTVKKVWNENKHRAGYMFKNALKDAKKVYGGKTAKAKTITMKSKSKKNKTRKSRRN
jgi:hypothetical protein